jgi:hypothetical protein
MPDTPTLATILKLIEGIIEAEHKISAAISSERDLKRRKALFDACASRDLAKIKELLYEVN